MTERVRVWIVPVDLPPDTAGRCAALLDDGERARAADLRSPRDRQRFVVAHGALRMLAGRALDERSAALRWTVGPHGKPELVPPWSRLHTSLSHSGDMIAAAVCTGRPVGVDIQHLVPGLDAVGLAVRFFPPDEAGYVAGDPDASVRADRFAQLWTRKEAVVKAVGGRLWPNLAIAVRDQDVVSCAEPAGLHRVCDVPAPAGYRAAAAVTGAAPFAMTATLWPGAEPVLPAAVS